MNGIGIINKNLKELWDNNMKTKIEELEPLKEALKVALDAQEGQYDKFIDSAIKKSINFCKRLLPTNFGEILKTEIKLKTGQPWYELESIRINNIKNVYIEINGKIKLHNLKTFDFLNLPSNLGIPRSYTNFNGKIGVNPAPCADDLILILEYIGYNTAYLLNEWFDMLFTRALYIMHKDITGDRAAAQQCLQDFNEQVLSYNVMVSKQNCAGYIKATSF